MGGEDITILQNVAGGSDHRRKIKPQNPCKGCYYHGGKTATVSCCNYYLITGMRRPCETGDACTVRKDSIQPKRKPISIKK